MVALKRRHFGVLLATFALVVSFFGLAQFVGAQAPASAAPLSCPEPTTNVSNKVTLDWTMLSLSTMLAVRPRLWVTGGTSASSCRGRPTAA